MSQTAGASFSVVVKDVKAALAKAEKAISAARGVFKGDDKKGTYTFNGDGGSKEVVVGPFKTKIVIGKYSISGRYSVDKNEINTTCTIDVDAQSAVQVTAKELEKKMREWF